MEEVLNTNKFLVVEVSKCHKTFLHFGAFFTLKIGLQIADFEACKIHQLVLMWDQVLRGHFSLFHSRGGLFLLRCPRALFIRAQIK